jgi:hypothetical protein
MATAAIAIRDSYQISSDIAALPEVLSPLETLEGAILDGLATGHQRRACFGDLLSGELRSVGEGGAGTMTWGALATMWEIGGVSDGELDSDEATASLILA